MNHFLTICILFASSALSIQAADPGLSIEIGHVMRHASMPSNYLDARKTGKKVALTPAQGNCLLKVVGLVVNPNKAGDPLMFNLSLSGITVTPKGGSAQQAWGSYNYNKRWAKQHKADYNWPRPTNQTNQGVKPLLS